MQPPQICIGHTIRIGREGWCHLYAGFLLYIWNILWINLEYFWNILGISLACFGQCMNYFCHKGHRVAERWELKSIIPIFFTLAPPPNKP